MHDPLPHPTHRRTFVPYRPFNDTLSKLRHGRLNDELGEKLAELTSRCQETGRAGAITLTISLKPGKAGQMEVYDDVKIKQPKEERGSTILWSTPDGNLQREDTGQLQLDGLRTVNTEPGELRQVTSKGTA